ncbi:MAG: hypothetical protein KJ587_18950 [Alphaproteobacteria bacterium]|nr:hypothetical protein [Alphaproteobacteria bacterium]
MKRIAVASALLILATGAASAHSTAKSDDGYHAKGHTYAKVKKHSAGKLTLRERLKIARDRARLAALKRRIHANGKVSYREQLRLKKAKASHRKLVRSERRD